MPDYSQAQKQAEAIWQDLSLSSPPLPILEVAESYGLNVLDADFCKYPGLSGVLDVNKGIIYVNRSDLPVRKRFTIAHELGHWILHRSDLDRPDSEYAPYYRRPIGGETDGREKEANVFAANLLVPLKQLMYFSARYSERQLAELFAVSQEVIGYRLKYLEARS